MKPAPDERLGIEPGYRDVFGEWRETPADVREALAAAMGPGAGIEAGGLEPVYVLRRSQLAGGLAFECDDPSGLAFRLVEEWGREHGGTVAGGRIAFPSGIPEGYHRLEVRRGEEAIAAATLVVVPDRCYLPSALAEERLWGCAVQLYGVRSARNAGIGDFTDLAALASAWGGRGAAVVGTNPLHALSLVNVAASPYSPASRLMMHPIYLDVEAIAEFPALAEGDAAAVERYRAEAQRLRELPLVDYPAVTAAKLEILERLHAAFRRRHAGTDDERERAFEAFRRRGGEALRLHALHSALEEAHAGGWRAWPEEFRHPDTEAVKAFERDRSSRIGFHEYLQWQCDLQLAAAAAHCRAIDMTIGLYADLAVSISRDGSEAWANQAAYAIGASVGAPPDELNPRGQDWGLPPMIPRRLKELAYAPFIATLRANMAHAGAIRIDHVMGLARLYWVPAGRPPTEGGYVRYPLEDLLGLLALESHRHRCLVIGEDLGTVPAELFARLQDANVLSYRLLLFERDAGRGYKPVGDYPAKALVGWATHDLPPFALWWKNADAQERGRLAETLVAAGTLRAGPDVLTRRAAASVALAMHAWLAKSPSALFLMQMEDVLGVDEQANVPGDVSEHPNWRRKLPLPIESLDADPRFRRHARIAAQERGAARRGKVRPTAARIPRATYRLQLHKGFTLRDATRLVGYLDALGVSHVYCSPYLRARAGSTHGYDIVDHAHLNPEIGTRADLDAFVKALRAHGMGQVMDVVPNHMGVMGHDNAWWMDVLEHGPASPYAGFFDIEWRPHAPHLAGRVLLPLLGGHYGRELAAGRLQLRFDAATGSLAVWYADHHRLPVDPRTYPLVLREACAAPAFARVMEALAALPERAELPPDASGDRREQARAAQAVLARLAKSDSGVAEGIERAVAAVNGIAGDAASFDAMDRLIEAQAWRPAYWRVAGDEINYRRFFDINELAALRMENEPVFRATHKLVLDLVAEGLVDGLRIDHPDGLLDPRRYFERLQAACRRPQFVVVEKIIAPFENLPRDWPAHGTTGYRFANVVNGLFVDDAARGAMTRAYENFAGEREPFHDVARDARRLILRTSLAGELNTAAQELSRIALADRDTRDYTANALRAALAEVIAAFPVYRTYVTETGAGPEDRRFIAWAVRLARREGRAADASIYDFIERLLLCEAYPQDDPRRGPAIRFARRIQQLTAPVMAKGVEDTAFYRYNRLLSLNDVGGDPDEFGMTVTRFHRASANRARHWPHTMLATSTHDNKRSEDVRARLDVITEDPAAWRLHLGRWGRMNERHRRVVDEGPAPSRNDEYLIYQTLLGTLPAEAHDERTLGAYRERLAGFLEKAMREAKVHSSWANVNEEYEAATQAFAAALLADAGFLADLRQVLEPVAWAGRLNSLAMAAIKLTSPGVPDIYQGNELLDFSLVDPDNRRPVDFERRRKLLERVLSGELPDAGDEHAKLFVIQRLLQLRREDEALFRDSGYTAVRAHGPRARHVVAYARRHEGRVVVCVAPRLTLKMGVAPGALPCGESAWGDTEVGLPFIPSGTVLRDVFTHEERRLEGGVLRAAQALTRFPVAVLASAPASGRGPRPG